MMRLKRRGIKRQVPIVKRSAEERFFRGVIGSGGVGVVVAAAGGS